jgi:hypothetical protein
VSLHSNSIYAKPKWKQCSSKRHERLSSAINNKVCCLLSRRFARFITYPANFKIFTGYQSEAWVGATGTTTDVENKRALLEAQMKCSVEKAKIQNAVDVLEVQV